MKQKQEEQFNRMLATLKRIGKEYMTPDQMRRRSEKEYGLCPEEGMEMEIENIQAEAKNATRGVKAIPMER